MKTRGTLLLVAGIVVLAGGLAAQDAALKERFLQRQPVVDEWKSQGKAGENNVGKLVARVQLGEKETEILNAENADRETVYQDIAARLNITPLEVGRRRALQIAELAAPGTWLQHPEGDWYQKKN